MQRTQGMRNSHQCHIGDPWEQQTSTGTFSPSSSESGGNMGKDGWETTNPQGQHKGPCGGPVVVFLGWGAGGNNNGNK